MSFLPFILLLLPLLGALAMLLPVPWFDERRNAWAYSLGVTLVTFLASLLLWWMWDWNDPRFQFDGGVGWARSLGLGFDWGLDAISLWLVLLTTFLMPITVLASHSAVPHKPREFFFWLTILESAMIGTFIATNLIFFYICFEFTLVPLFFLIGTFGSTDRLRAARVFFLYTFTGSMLTFAGVLYVAFVHATRTGGGWTFDIASLYATAASMSHTEQALVLLALLAGFAVKVPLFPVHTWLPLAHTEAPTAGSVILAGVLLKLGTYGLLRLAIPMAPEAVVTFAPWIAGLAIVGILYAALVCWVQKDVKKLVAYSSVSHLGFCVLGLFALDVNVIGATGATLYMINHGLSTGALFLCIGMIYERFHTREMAAMSGLAKTMPVWAFFMVFFVMASVGLPGLNGFVGEFMTLMGTFTSTAVLGPWFAAVAGVGMIFAAIYLLYLTGRIVWGEPVTPHVDAAWTRPDDHHRVRDLTGREVAVLTPLAVMCLVLGLFPQPLIRSLEGPVGTMVAPAQAVAAARHVDDATHHIVPIHHDDHLTAAVPGVTLR